MLMRRFLFVIPLLLLGACASGPTFQTAGVDRTLTPRGVAAEPQRAMGQTVLWGGVILTTTNLQDSTQIEVLAYPLDSNEWPLRDNEPLGRFLLLQDGYLEPASYAEGRLISVTGTVTGTRAGRVGDTAYAYPVISAGQLYLWPRDSARDRTRVIFGVGVGVGL
ncbi:MAG: Slp family lipoprotein [Gammaproteobacteria bacterium]